MEPTPQLMRDTMRFWASGVSVVTSVYDGLRCGMTVSAFNSLSLEPPQVLICLYKDTNVAKRIQESGLFAVSILDAEQATLSDRFAGRIPLGPDGDRFDGVPTFEAETGAPVLTNALAWVDCRVQSIHDGGTHWIVVGEVVSAGHREGDPLVYFNRRYHELQPVKEPLLERPKTV